MLCNVTHADLSEAERWHERFWWVCMYMDLGTPVQITACCVCPAFQALFQGSKALHILYIGTYISRGIYRTVR